MTAEKSMAWLLLLILPRDSLACGDCSEK